MSYEVINIYFMTFLDFLNLVLFILLLILLRLQAYIFSHIFETRHIMQLQLKLLLSSYILIQVRINTTY